MVDSSDTRVVQGWSVVLAPGEGLRVLVDVHAPDAVGVLYAITRAFADLDLDIVSAKVHTLGPLVVDSFYLRDAAGRKVTDQVMLDEIERAVLHALADD